MRTNVDPKSISLRDPVERDVPFILEYWYRSPPGFIESMGADPSKLPPEAQFEETLLRRIRENAAADPSKLNSLLILNEGRPIGFHTLNPIVEADFGVFHAHVVRPEFRGRGVAVCSYPIACLRFIQRFDLKRILFKTPLQNVGAIRVKEKLGIRCIAEEEVDFGIIRAGTRTKVYELTREEAERLAGGRV